MDLTALNALARSVTKGDDKAYTALLRECARIVRGYIFNRAPPQDRGGVEDVVQDTLLAIHTKFHTYDPAQPFVPWLVAVTRHKMIDHWRRNKQAPLAPFDDALDDIAIVETQGADTAHTLEKLLGHLNDKQRRVVELARIEGRSMAEIAADMGISVADTKVTLHRALLKLAAHAQEGNTHAD